MTLTVHSYEKKMNQIGKADDLFLSADQDNQSFGDLPPQDNGSQMGINGAAGSGVAKAMPTAPKYKKAPDAPKRFKSAFIIFSAEKHKEIKETLAKQGRSEKTTDIAKLVSEAWREMPPDEKEGWEKKARKDKARYEVEKAMYKGPWKIPANKRTPKDPTAPKRPMSAFLAFSNKRRAALKREHPDATNADLSKMLSKSWKEAPDEMRKKYMDEEAGLRSTYKIEMAKWRKKVAEEKKLERQEREAMAMQAAEARTNPDGSVVPLSVNEPDPRQFARAGGDPGMGGPPVGQQQQPPQQQPQPQQNQQHAQQNHQHQQQQQLSQQQQHPNQQQHLNQQQPNQQQQQDMNGGGMGQQGMFGNPYGMGSGGGGGGGQLGEFGGYGGMPPGSGPGGYGGLMGNNPFAAQSLMGHQSAQQQLISQLFNQQFKPGNPMGGQQMGNRNNMGLYGQGQGMQGGQQNYGGYGGMGDMQQMGQGGSDHGGYGNQGMNMGNVNDYGGGGGMMKKEDHHNYRQM